MIQKRVGLFHLIIVMLVGIIAPFLVEYIGNLGAIVSVLVVAGVSTAVLIRTWPRTGDIERSQVQSSVKQTQSMPQVDMYGISEDLSFISQQLLGLQGIATPH